MLFHLWLLQLLSLLSSHIDPLTLASLLFWYLQVTFLLIALAIHKVSSASNSVFLVTHLTNHWLSSNLHSVMISEGTTLTRLVHKLRHSRFSYFLHFCLHHTYQFTIYFITYFLMIFIPSFCLAPNGNVSSAKEKLLVFKLHFFFFCIAFFSVIILRY